MPDMSLERIASAINTLGGFLGMRDVPELSAGAISDLTGHEHADVMVLFGGSILAGGDVLARAMRAGVADKHIIVGGEGHTTFTIAGPTGEGLTSARSFTRRRRCVLSDGFRII